MNSYDWKPQFKIEEEVVGWYNEDSILLAKFASDNRISNCILRRHIMAVSYNRLWHILIDRDMSKTQLIKMAGITTNAMARMGKNEDVRVEVLAKICTALGCTMDEILEIIPDNGGEE